MFTFLGRIRGVIAGSLSPQPTMRFGGNRASDDLPPLLEPSMWSHGLVECMADRSTAWYFDRR